ncbi:hypothetical protein [uncultured Chitinophaga sp.]|jgi:hypothetical protein|uniref:hypothetical protein n=1 Tax=uncultured Chitinophaga sp. TaxID=339340 RepID=UPI00262CA5A6|nr:hypothetical protein [uncultured Chitinophaga sp.]
MKPHCCCGTREATRPAASLPPPAEVPSQKPSLLKRLGNGIRWMLPGAILILIPKCPMCLAAYIALGTGIGLSVTTAQYLRTGLIAGCILSLAYMLVKQLKRV